MSIIDRNRKVHFVGIGGIGMSGLAEILCRSGHFVTGSDLNASDATARLEGLGATVQIGHGREILDKHRPDVVVYSTAVPRENPELQFARDNKVPVIRRAEMLGELMRLRRGIAVAGSHGKTTTTGLLSLVLSEAGLDPAVVIGGRFDAIGANAQWGEGPWLVAEADESDGSFNRLTPEMAIVTNIDKEHLNHYGSFEATLKAFEDFLDRLPFYGKAVLCSDCANVRGLLPGLNKSYVTYGFDAEHEPDYQVVLLENSATPVFEVKKMDETVLSLSLSVPGRHNVLNAAAAGILALELGVQRQKVEGALSHFKGVQRRFENRGRWSAGILIEDYAHHPTEIAATMQACSVSHEKKPFVIFQPHRYSRSRELWQEFGECFAGAEKVFVLPIYPASEPRELWVDQYDGLPFAKNIKGVAAEFVADFEQARRDVESEAEKNSDTDRPLLILGAGNISKIIPDLLKSSEG